MENQIVKTNGALVKSVPSEMFIPLEEFNKKLNEKPSKTEKIDNAEYVPITIVEMELDEDYLGLWQTENFTWNVVANEIVGKLDLVVFHPVAKTWIRRTGAASVMIRQKRDASITDIAAKIKNGLIMDFPKLHTACLKAAAKTLGKKYGRDLNRKWEDEYTSIYGEETEANETLAAIHKEMEDAKTTDDLLAIWNKNPDLHSNQFFKSSFATRRKQLSVKQK